MDDARAPYDYGQGLKPGERRPGRYAASAIGSRGRQYDEPECTMRSPFQRDRDRILHSTAFRRLTHKTQVFIYHEGDHYRSRLTHSLEVAQIARTVARQLRLDEDLAEVLALAHDLGHSPFGHAGERALDRVMQQFGGFDHNAQSLRVVTRLERKYFAFDGLNLTWEALEGLAKHNGPVKPAAHGDIVNVLADIERWRSLNRQTWASAEAQVAALADDIAYLSHDFDDGMRAGLLTLEDVEGVPLAAPAVARARKASSGNEDHGRMIFEITRRMITEMVGDLVKESRVRLARLAPETADDIRNAGDAVIAFSDFIDISMKALKNFLYDGFYHHSRIMRAAMAAEKIVEDLFNRYFEDTAALPGRWREAAQGLDGTARARVIADFVAGQTDRYAVAEHRRLFDATPDLR